ncbi:MAG: exodeoxyribonuclease VII small subunit [Methanobrevibacter boviskoreani]|jgi:exodeoxyribonuclease VII small subunit|uniref:exodeoxyribonuclease VII small subunit n=1 Tax=Methanobrevibacter boviskoreani TaxID=1348249 RepID=UPI0006ACAB2B|nr:exodeoxyribonuclease VII small subunit [Methanobrevibacter boviskoreani]MCI6774643.1 exodeoxyribonuclease VII small subunit [Methanobrevibacter boviskoreani]MCI6931317.1 exodeoxyribonuclease VII small subunit [Methanobrevibacter boviskoreani]MDD6256924.1 exodeoxyribonuclease VII small subunit [Methanobrevibacter boviskoreani]MDY5614159.1 exodeoxyribonuclease VII small subunit [Methanobrevibacter boviskoreani]
MENNNLEDYYKQKNIEDNSFEENIKELEDIVNRLESGDIPLDDAIKEFNKAMTLVKSCDEKLKEAKDSISKIVKENGEIIDFNLDENTE